MSVNPDYRSVSEKYTISIHLNIYTYISATLSQTVDAVIYIFLQKDIRELFCETFNLQRCTTIRFHIILYRLIGGRRNEAVTISVQHDVIEENIPLQNL